MIKIEIDDDDIERTASEFAAATATMIKAARLRALRKTVRWFGGQILRVVAKKERMPLRALHNRVFVHQVKPDAESASVFIGTAPVDVTRFGNPVQTPKGVRVGRQSYRGAFLGRVYTGQEKVWIRQASRFHDPARYPTIRRSGDRGAFSDASLMGRFPVVRAAVPINDAVESVAGMLESDVRPRFLSDFRHELNFEVIK